MSTTQHQTLGINQIDDEFIFDTNHIIMNYLKMNSFSKNCFTETDIQISQSIMSVSLSAEIIQNYNKLANQYFTLLSEQDNVIDILSPLISSYPNSDFGLFLAVLLKNHIINIALSLINSLEIFEKYKNS